MATKRRGIRDGFGAALLELGAQHPHVVALSADLQESVRMLDFAQQFPDRFFELGVAEQNVIGVAAGLAAEGFTPFAGSFAAFSPGRTFDQIRVSVCYANRNVKVVGGHAGLTVGEDGATHQMLEDLAMMRVLPNMSVYIPADYQSAFRLTHHAALTAGPTYLRLSRHSVPDCIPDSADLSGPVTTRPGTEEIVIIFSGVLGERAHALAERVESETGIRPKVLALLQLKPLAEQQWAAVLESAKVVITLEEHQEAGGVGSALAELSVKTTPRPIESIGMRDSFGRSGPAEELLDYYGFSPEDLWQRVRKFLTRHQII